MQSDEKLFQCEVTHGIRDEIPRGWKGAAFAALGDIVAVFFMVADAIVGEDPLEDSNVGVKLGESTFKRFLSHKRQQAANNV